MQDAQAVISMMGAAIASLFGFIIWLYKETLNRADRRITTLEDREASKFVALTKAVESIEGMTKILVEGFREMRLAMMERREGPPRS